jgi:endonuclease V-like protein UPF0215 family
MIAFKNHLYKMVFLNAIIVAFKNCIDKIVVSERYYKPVVLQFGKMKDERTGKKFAIRSLPIGLCST